MKKELKEKRPKGVIKGSLQRMTSRKQQIKPTDTSSYDAGASPARPGYGEQTSFAYSNQPPAYGGDAYGGGGGAGYGGAGYGGAGYGGGGGYAAQQQQHRGAPMPRVTPSRPRP